MHVLVLWSRLLDLWTGSLHFSNIEESDSRSSALYVCVVYNAELRNIVEGDDQRIEPVKITGIRLSCHLANTGETHNSPMASYIEIIWAMYLSCI